MIPPFDALLKASRIFIRRNAVQNLQQEQQVNMKTKRYVDYLPTCELDLNIEP